MYIDIKVNKTVPCMPLHVYAENSSSICLLYSVRQIYSIFESHGELKSASFHWC